MRSKIKNWIYSDKRIFAKGMSFKKMYLIFVLGSFFGTIYEDILSFSKHLFIKNEIYLATHRGVIYGPFNPLYGVGIVLVIYLLGRKKRSAAKTFIYGALLGGTIEYIVSFLMDKLLELPLGIILIKYLI